MVAVTHSLEATFTALNPLLHTTVVAPCLVLCGGHAGEAFPCNWTRDSTARASTRCKGLHGREFLFERLVFGPECGHHGGDVAQSLGPLRRCNHCLWRRQIDNRSGVHAHSMGDVKRGVHLPLAKRDLPIFPESLLAFAPRYVIGLLRSHPLLGLEPLRILGDRAFKFSQILPALRFGGPGLCFSALSFESRNVLAYLGRDWRLGRGWRLGSRRSGRRSGNGCSCG